MKELIRNGAYSRLYEHYHEYELPPAVLCTLGQEGCSVERAYEALKIHAVPGGPKRMSPVQDGERSPASFARFPGGHVLTHLEEATHSIINVTEPDHRLHDGLVQRRIVVEGGKVVLRTFGIGNNSSRFHAWGNEEGAGMAFAELTDRIRVSVNPEAGKRSREDWFTLTPNPAMGPSGFDPQANAMSIRKIVKGAGVTVLIGIPLLIAAAIFLSLVAFLIMIGTIGWPMGI